MSKTPDVFAALFEIYGDKTFFLWDPFAGTSLKKVGVMSAALHVMPGHFYVRKKRKNRAWEPLAEISFFLFQWVMYKNWKRIFSQIDTMHNHPLIAPKTIQAES